MSSNSSHFCFNVSYKLNRNLDLIEVLAYKFNIICMLKNQIKNKTANDYTGDVVKKRTCVIHPVSLSYKLYSFLYTSYIWAFCLLGFNVKMHLKVGN